MSSANNTLEVEDGHSPVEQESVPLTSSVLDKSKSLFGKSSSVFSAAAAREPTPEAHSGESSAANDSLVAMEAGVEEQTPVDTTPTNAENESATHKERAEQPDEEPMDNVAQLTPEPENTNKPEQEDEVFEKKIISMDTSRENGEALETAEEMETEINGEEREEEEDEDDAEDEEEEEAPKKKAKRTVLSEDADDDDDEQEEEEQEEEQADEPEIVAADQPALEEGEQEDDSESLVIDESAEKSVTPPEDDAAPEAQPTEEVEEPEKEEPEQEEPEQEEQQEEETSSTRRTRGRRFSAAASAPTSSSATLKRATRGRASQGKKEEHKDEQPVEEKITNKRGKASRSSKKEEEAPEPEDSEDVGDDQDEVAPVEESPKKGRARRSAAKKEEESAEEAQEEEEPEAETPKKGGRGRRSAAAVTPATPRQTRGKGKQSNIVEQEEKEDEEIEEEQVKKTRGRKPPAKVEEVEDGEEEDEEEEGETAEAEEAGPSTSSRRSARTRTTPKSAPITPASKRTPARGGRKKQTSLTEDVIEEEGEETTETPHAKKGRSGTRSAPSSSKKKNEFDPYDMDTEMEHHPDPLKNIQVEVQSFGTVKYGRVGSSAPKYSMTEKSAVSLMPATSNSKNRRSLADMTPSKEKAKVKAPVASGGRKPRAKKEGNEEPEDVEMEELEQPTPSATPASANRGRKRKSEAAAITPAKKQASIINKQLSDEEQLRVDQPQDDNEPHAPGSRVYAVFQKTFYPAVIVADRDGLGRFKLQFTADNVVKDVPNAGIIPLRAVTTGKTAIFEENDVRVNVPPSDFSAKEWAKGQLTIGLLDDEEVPTGEVKTVDWKELSFDQAEWRDYIKIKEQTATAITASNIASFGETHRVRKPVLTNPTPKPKGRKKVEGLVQSRGASTPRDDDEDDVLPMDEKGVGKSIFAGKLFMLTSANRSATSPTPPVFRKKNLTSFLVENGGIVVEQLDDFQGSHPNLTPILISDTFYRTHKYLAALARGIPCVKNVWLQECGERGECIDFKDFVLPAGTSIYIEGQEMPAPENPSELLAGKTIYVHSTHDARELTQTGPGGTFVEIWKPILHLLGANTVENDWRTLEETHLQFDVVLVDGTFEPQVMTYADKIGASKVTSEWVIQTIMLSGAPDPKSHQKFNPYCLNHRNARYLRNPR
ncbi:unnamed protein product [Caenorhabditis sp. 36 PRJEB53466]|nr:unnamed protein product [Caenorhabditis sp. 36 PRJEB53466]